MFLCFLISRFVVLLCTKSVRGATAAKFDKCLSFTRFFSGQSSQEQNVLLKTRTELALCRELLLAVLTEDEGRVHEEDAVHTAGGGVRDDETGVG